MASDDPCACYSLASYRLVVGRTVFRMGIIYTGWTLMKKQLRNVTVTELKSLSTLAFCAILGLSLGKPGRADFSISPSKHWGE